jgi:hypothetical protein
VRGTTTRTPERVAEAQHLRAEGKMWREIADIMGVAMTTAQEWGTDPDASKRRARKAKYDLECVDCGGRVDGTTPGKMANPDEPVCGHCAAEHYAVWTRDAIVLCIQDWADDHGGIPPSANDFSRARVFNPGAAPNVNHVLNRFGSWNAAIREAGFEPYASGPVGGYYTALTLEQRAECARRYAAGESSIRIAADMGCAPHIVTKWARRAGVPIRDAFAKRAA